MGNVNISENTVLVNIACEIERTEASYQNLLLNLESRVTFLLTDAQHCQDKLRELYQDAKYNLEVANDALSYCKEDNDDWDNCEYEFQQRADARAHKGYIKEQQLKLEKCVEMIKLSAEHILHEKQRLYTEVSGNLSDSMGKLNNLYNITRNYGG